MARRSVLSTRWKPRLRKVEQDVAQLGRDLGNSALVLGSSQRIIQHDIQERFDETKLDPEGSPWQEWADSYAPIAEAHNENGILVRTSALRDAAIADGPFTIVGDSLLYDTGSLPEYAAAHQFGMVVGKGVKLPKRAFLGVSRHAEAEVVGVFTGFVEGNIAIFYNRSGRAQFQTRTALGQFGPVPTFD